VSGVLPAVLRRRFPRQFPACLLESLPVFAVFSWTMSTVAGSLVVLSDLPSA
jgi:hypothetical protein